MENKVNFKVFGEGYPVIIMHGLLGMLDNWQTFARSLADEYMVYTIDLRNHGKSFHHPEMDYLTMADDLRMFMESNHIFNAHIMGHSMGGKVAMQFALENPGMVDKLIIADIAPHSYPGGHEEILDALREADIQTATNRQQVEDQLLKRIGDRAIVLFLMKNLSRNKDGSFRWKPNLEAIYSNYEKILDEVNSFDTFEKPTLFIKGQNSAYISDKSLDSIQALFSAADIIKVPGAGHWVHADAPGETLRITAQYLDR